jgi:integrase
MSASLYIGQTISSSPAAALRRILCNAVVSGNSKRAYSRAFDDFFLLLEQSGGPLCRAVLMEYRARMVDAGLSASTINLRLSAVRRLILEARDNGLLDPLEAARITTVPGALCEGVRLGNWLTAEEAGKLLAVPDRNTLKGKRDYVILAVLVFCALRRAELANLDVSRVEQREGRWFIVDLVGKRNRFRTVPIPSTVKSAIDEWTLAGGISSGRLLRRLSRGGRILGNLSDWAVWSVVVNAARAIGIEHLAPHDLRRTSAKLCQRHGGTLADLKQFLGHASVATTERYLGNEQQIAAINEDLGI